MWDLRFDVIVVDAPCSNLGVILNDFLQPVRPEELPL